MELSTAATIVATSDLKNVPRNRRNNVNGKHDDESTSTTNKGVHVNGEYNNHNNPIDKRNGHPQQQQRHGLYHKKQNVSWMSSPRRRIKWIVLFVLCCFGIFVTIINFKFVRHQHTTTPNSDDEKKIITKSSPKSTTDRETTTKKRKKKDTTKFSSLEGTTKRRETEITPPSSFVTIDDWNEHVRQTMTYQQKHGVNSIRKHITAYVEPWYLFNDTIPGTGSRGNMKKDKDPGVPPQFVVPLPLRVHTPDDLRKYVYTNAATTCHDMPGKFPIDRGLEKDTITGETIISNVGDTPTNSNFPWDEATYCPVEADPFLPWIHDVFPESPLASSSSTTMGGDDTSMIRSTKIHFIAQNKRKCRTGSKFTENVNRLVPQVALMQSVSVQRINDAEAQELSPNLWNPNTNNNDDPKRQQQTRYRLAPYEEADADGMYTRFICQFHTTIYANNEEQTPRQVLLGETLSAYPFNYEMVSYRKGKPALLTPKGKDTMLFWTSNLHFECPIPESIQNVVATGMSILQHDGTPTIYIDLIPIRTSVRYDEIYLTEDMIGPSKDWSLPKFDAKKHWGANHVLPRIEASGRWTNIPICWTPQVPPPPPTTPTQQELQQEQDSNLAVERNLVEKKEAIGSITRKEQHDKPTTNKPHYLSACLWASSAFKTRGARTGADTATNYRLVEWIEFHLMAGFDHIYLYDNSGAHTNETSLQPVVDMFDPSQITRIDWPSIICNNNIPAHDSTGERSTQYAAENSCRSRHAPFTEWIVSFDTDEYLIPMGNYSNLKDVLHDASKKGTNILSFRSSRGRLRKDQSTAIIDNNTRNFEKSPNSLFLEAYNCDSAGSPKPDWGERARKQIYRSDYVLYHFVHYSTVTQGYLVTYKNATDQDKKWKHRYSESPPSERHTDELNEAVLVHTKTISREMTNGWEDRCRYDYPKKWQGCWVAFPWPNNITVSDTLNKESSNSIVAYNSDGYDYNCFMNNIVEDYWIPRLRQALKERMMTTST